MESVKENKSVYCHGEVFDYAGIHLLVDFWKAKNISDATATEQILKDAVIACGATLLEVHAHTFSPYKGISGIAILKESHISVHTWPEFEYAALDVFVCGDVDPYKALPVLKDGFDAEEMQIMELKRGIFDGKQVVL
ncbi:MAG: adenosylmethionine decarboxylase [Candidatus Saelkia tenebricola]|nr:adenosylmethionine decarboxylase [Candidatus Saelkia tenebricola]